MSLLRYFGEAWPETGCGGCDNCLTPRQTFDGTLAAQKLLSCVYRVRERSGFAFGLNHIVEVLTGADTEAVRKWDHTALSTYGIGRDLKRAAWLAVGRELIRLGCLRLSAGKFSVVELTPEGARVLKARQSVTLTALGPVGAPETPRKGEIACDEALFDALARLRRDVAAEHAVPPHIVFSDVSLREMARFYPANLREFSRVTGVSKQKLHDYGPVFVRAVAHHLLTHPRQVFADD